MIVASLKIDPERLVFACEAARAARVSPQLINSWRTRRLLFPVDEVDGRLRYRLGDVLNVNAATLRSGCSSRAKTRVRLSA